MVRKARHEVGEKHLRDEMRKPNIWTRPSTLLNSPTTLVCAINRISLCQTSCALSASAGEHGVVFLEGVGLSPVDMERAERSAQAVPGVRDVVDNIFSSESP
jgi:hypothetical protein